MTTKVTETRAQAHCPYCHFDHNENTELIPIVNGYLSIDPESSKLIDRENWDYRDDGPSDYSASHHINYCYMCGRKLNGED